MKKFTLMAGLAAIATIGSAFAAWQFEHEGKPENLEAEQNLLIDQNIIVDGFNGEATLTRTAGNNIITLQQKEKDAYAYEVVDTGDQEVYQVKYVPTLGEHHEEIKIKYTWKFFVEDEVYNHYSNTVSLVHGAGNSTAGEYTYDITFESFGHEFKDCPTNVEIDNTEALYDWLTLNEFKLELLVEFL